MIDEAREELIEQCGIWCGCEIWLQAVVAVVGVALAVDRGRFNGEALLVEVGLSWSRFGVIGAGDVC